MKIPTLTSTMSLIKAPTPLLRFGVRYDDDDDDDDDDDLMCA